MSGHRFEGWFASTVAFDEQVARQQVSCPFCDSTEVARLPSGPYVVRQPSKAPAAASPEVVAGLLKALIENSEDVGQRFAEEARRIHREEVPPRQIRGTASVEDAAELLDEGISILPLPIPRKDETH